MKARILKIDPHNIDLKQLQIAADVIKRGGLVAFPTETVYGLGADAFNAKAVSGIFEAKKRPLDDPLIVHISRKEDVNRLASDISKEAEKLMERFWPGPLTLVLKKKEIVPDIVSAGLDTVAIRMPSHPVARKFIGSANTPIAAPSANLFGRPSPTTARDVVEDLGNEIDIVIDSGNTEIGVESTVAEFLGKEVTILRPGGISPDEIREVVKRVTLYDERQVIARSPGKYPRHYSPHAHVVVIPDEFNQIVQVRNAAGKFLREGKKAGILAKEEHVKDYEGFNVKAIGPSGDPKVCAANLFRLLREFDREEADVIVVEAISEKGIGLAVMNRLRKAAGG
jgi:L-threonylcarbamoyladenylate synthase